MTGAKPICLPRSTLPSSKVMMMSEPAGKKDAPPPSSGESSRRITSMRDRVLFWSTVSSPLMGLPVKPSMRVLDWCELTAVSPRVAKSPTCTVPRPPTREVRLVTSDSWSFVLLPPVRLRRE